MPTAICEAVQRPNMRFMPVKCQTSRSMLCIHRLRQGMSSSAPPPSTASAACLREFGFVLPQKAATVRREAAAQLDALPGWANTAVGACQSAVAPAQRAASPSATSASCQMAARSSTAATLDAASAGRRLHDGQSTVSTIFNARDFKNGRQFAAWLGLMPRQYSSGGKNRLGGITKAGDTYLRTLLMQGAKSVHAAAQNQHDLLSRWALALEVRTRLPEGSHRSRHQERTHPLGSAHQGRRLRSESRP